MICPGCGNEAREAHPACLKRLAGARASAGAQGRAREFNTQQDIARMSQPARDAILQHPAIRTPRRRD